MPTSTDRSFSDAQVRLAERLKALAHPARLAIVRLLAERDECICGEIVGDLPLAQSTVSQHLKTLREAGLVQGTVEGPRTCYCLAPEAMRELEEEFTGYLSVLDEVSGSGCC